MPSINYIYYILFILIRFILGSCVLSNILYKIINYVQRHNHDSGCKYYLKCACLLNYHKRWHTLNPPVYMCILKFVSNDYWNLPNNRRHLTSLQSNDHHPLRSTIYIPCICIYPHLSSSVLICPHLSSSVLICPHLSSSVLICPHLSSSVLICPHLSSSVLICPHLSSSVLICPHLFSVAMWTHDSI